MQKFNFLKEEVLSIRAHPQGGTQFHFFVDAESVGKKVYHTDKTTIMYDRKFNPVLELKTGTSVFIMSREPVYHEKSYYCLVKTRHDETGYINIRHVKKPVKDTDKKNRLERQEKSLIRDINYFCVDGEPINIVDMNRTKIKNVLSAKKMVGKSLLGDEPLTDVILTTKTGQINISMKSRKAPSLGGGGWSGLLSIDDRLPEKIIKTAISWYRKNGYKNGDKGAPDLYIKVPKRINRALVIGTEEMGGNIDYIYIGDMEPQTEFDVASNTLKFLDGDLIPAEEFADQTQFYFRLRKRNRNQKLDFESTRNSGMPMLFRRGTDGESDGAMITLVNAPPKNQETVIGL